MDYAETLQWLYAQLPMYQRVGGAAYKADLTNTLLLDAYLGHPHTSFSSLHVAGTNGKGSVSSMLASVLQEAGYKVGLYTSPHLKDFRERIKINGQCIPETAVVSFVEQHRSFFESHSLSFFEMTVGLAFDFFKREKVDIAVVEVGMGGRLDSTNIIRPLLSIITNIGFDHMAFLGNTLPKIAAEKAGIIKENIPVVIGEYQPDTLPVFEKIAHQKNAPLYKAYSTDTTGYKTDLKGIYQEHNLKTALTSLQLLIAVGRFSISQKQLSNGLEHVVKNTGLLGRWQYLQHRPKIIADTAHNAEGLSCVMQQLATEVIADLHMVVGFVSDKDLQSIVSLFPKNARYYFCKPDVPRGRDAQEVSDLFAENGMTGKVYNSVTNALEAAKEKATAEDVIFVGGSTFVVAEVV